MGEWRTSNPRAGLACAMRLPYTPYADLSPCSHPMWGMPGIRAKAECCRCKVKSNQMGGGLGAHSKPERGVGEKRGIPADVRTSLTADTRHAALRRLIPSPRLSRWAGVRDLSNALLISL